MRNIMSFVLILISGGVGISLVQNGYETAGYRFILITVSAVLILYFAWRHVTWVLKGYSLFLWEGTMRNIMSFVLLLISVGVGISLAPAAGRFILITAPAVLILYFAWRPLTRVLKKLFLGFFIGKVVKASGIFKSPTPIEPSSLKIMNPLKQAASEIETRPVQTFIYVIRGDYNMVKIGVSSNPDARCAALQTGSPYRIELWFAAPVTGNAYGVESEAHDILVSNGVPMNGEWFDVTPELAIAAIRTAADKLGQPLFKVEA